MNGEEKSQKKQRFSQLSQNEVIWGALGYTLEMRESESVSAGEYQAAPGQQECMRCPAGTYQDRHVVEEK